LFEYEHRSEPLLPRRAFLVRWAQHAAVSTFIILGSWAVGAWGYYWFEGLAWIDAFLNAAMLLGGMGPVNALQTTGGKLFASFYALYSGLIFLAAAGLVFAPVIHRFFHGLHLDDVTGEQ
jgi:hypothetical protein